MPYTGYTAGNILVALSFSARFIMLIGCSDVSLTHDVTFTDIPYDKI